MCCGFRGFSFGLVLTLASVCSGHRQNARREHHLSWKEHDYSCLLLLIDMTLAHSWRRDTQAHSVNLQSMLKATDIDRIMSLTDPYLDLGKTTRET